MVTDEAEEATPVTTGVAARVCAEAGLRATTSAGSVVADCVEAAFTAAVFVPSLTLVVWFPSVVWFAAVAAPVGSGSDAADTATVLFGETATTSAGSVAIAAVDQLLRLLCLCRH